MKTVARSAARLFGPVLAMLAVPLASASCPPLSLFDVNPASGGPGDPVELSGTGFCGSPDAFFAWGFDGVRGFPFDLQSSAPGSLTGVVGPVVEAVDGPVILWSGRRVELPDAVLELADGLYHLHSSTVLLVQDATRGPRFSAVSGSGAGVTSALVGGKLQVDFAPPSPTSITLRPAGSGIETRGFLPQESENHITVVVVVTTTGSPDDDSGDEPDEDPQKSPKRWVLAFELDCFGAPPACSGNLAAAVGQAVEERGGSLGMTAAVTGTSLTLAHATKPIVAGFVTVLP